MPHWRQRRPSRRPPRCRRRPRGTTPDPPLQISSSPASCELVPPHRDAHGPGVQGTAPAPPPNMSHPASNPVLDCRNPDVAWCDARSHHPERRRMSNDSAFLAALAERVLIFDGAFGTWVQGRDLHADDFGGPALGGCNEHLVLTRPDEIARMHSEFFEAGVDAVETATFGAFPLVLNEYAIPETAFEINRRAAEIARDVAAQFTTGDRPRFVIGSIGPGTKLPSLGHIAYTRLRDDYEVQCDGLLAGGADVLLVETVYDLLQAK